MSGVGAGAMDWIAKARPQLLALGAVLAVTLIAAPDFFALEFRDGRVFGGAIDILNRGAPVALLAIGMALVIATRGIDLSVGAVMAIAGAASAAALNSGAPWPVAALVGLGAGVACGLWNGVLVAVIKIQPFVATLILMVAGRGIAQLITEGRILTFNDDAFAAIGSGSMLGLPIPAVIVIGALVVSLLLYRGSAAGLFVEAIGVNPRASWLAGVDTRAMLIGVYVWSGLMAGVAGVIAAADIRGADANNAGLWLELDAILAAVIGGASLFGGRFSISLAIIGALVLQTLKTLILHVGLPPQFNLVLMALAVAAILVVQSPAVQARLNRVNKARVEGRT